jgi:indolepyruvate ferredoxin oxidoreductase beta subunit
MEAIEPVTVTSGDAVYPDDDRLYAAVAQVTDQAAYIRGAELAAQVGNPRTANVVLLGALSALMERQGTEGPQVPVDTWLSVIIERVPAKYVELNKGAFEAGRQAVLQQA